MFQPIVHSLLEILFMSFQYTYDAKGNPVGVFVPINEWEQLTAELQKATKPNVKSPVLRSIEKGLREMNAIKEGKLKSIPLQRILDEL